MKKLWNLGEWSRTFVVWAIALTAALLVLSACTARIEGIANSNPDAGLTDTASNNQLMCQAGLTACGNACVNLQAANDNCGRCGAACQAPAVCASGSCDSACADGYKKCGDTCINLQTNSGHCGSCDKVCDAGVPCVGGVCGCPDSVLFCQGQCFDPKSDAQHCGSCETPCMGGAGCSDGKCACGVGEQLCGAECSNLNSPQHCGSCDKACATGEICAVTGCIPSTQACPSGLTRCGDACVNLQTTAGACGSCETKCGAGQACTGGSCGCPAGKAACGSSCVDLATSALNCGACAKTCTVGQTCQAGQCKCADATDILCDNACTDPKTDAQHCGGCATQCMGGLPCTNGICACPEGETLCDGKCTSTDSTAAHCGGCGMACPVGESCQASKCSGAIGDSCNSTLAVGISLDEIDVYQVGKIPVMKGNQVVAKAERPADIVQGKAGRVRAFVTLESGWVNRTVSARLLLTNGDVKSNYFSKRNVTQPSTENSLATTFNFDVKAEDFTATTRYAVEIVECDGTPAGPPGKARFPATDNQELETRQTGAVKITFIPLNANGKTAASDTARLDAYKAYLSLMYPTSGVQYTVGPALNVSKTVSAQGNGWSEALDQLSALHQKDNAPADVYYYGLFQPSDTINQYCNGGCVAGIGFVTTTQNGARHQRVALGLSYNDITSAQTMAHEVGHNHGRPHSPCGGAAQPDPKYPYAGAKIGWWGFEAPEKLHNPATDTDIMGYCKNQWISDYTYRLLTDRVAFLNGAARELPPPGDAQHLLYLLTDFTGPRWGVERPEPQYPSGEPEQANVLDDAGNVIASVTVYRTPMDHLGGALLQVPDPEPGWHAIQVQGEVPLPFGATTQSQ